MTPAQRVQARQLAIAERRRVRLEVAARLWSIHREIDAASAVKWAEDLIEVNEKEPTRLEGKP